MYGLCLGPCKSGLLCVCDCFLVKMRSSTNKIRTALHLYEFVFDNVLGIEYAICRNNRAKMIDYSFRRVDFQSVS